MSIFLGAVAQNWAGTHLPSRFEAYADTGRMPLEGGSTDSAPVYKIPDGAREVKLTATPQMTTSRSPYWENTVFFTVGPNGLVVKAGFEGFATLRTVQLDPAPPANLATIILARFKDVTADTLALLGAPPATRRWYRTAGEVDPNTGVKYKNTGWFIEATTNEIAALPRSWKEWPPDDWELEDLAGVHFIDPALPVMSSNTMNFVRDKLVINVKSLVLEIASNDAPRLFGVAWPDALPRGAGAKPTPFLLFIEQGLQGNVYDAFGRFVGPSLAAYPYNFDYAYMLYQQLHYAGRSRTAGAWTAHPTPFLNSVMKGVPYQVARAGANVVTVVPINSFDQEYGVMDDTEQTGLILEELQAFMFMTEGVAPPASVGKTAIAAFSSGTHILYKWLASEANRKGKFLTNTVKAVYFLDPPRDPRRPEYDVNTYINAVLTWSAGGTDKRIRLYNRDHSDAHGKLLGQPTPSAPYVRNSSNGRNTAAELPTADWIAALAKVGGDVNGMSARDRFAFAHHMFAASMLTHALSQNDLS